MKCSIIIHRRNEEKYQRCIEFVSRLEIPTGYMVDVITIDGGKNRAAAYNRGMSQSDAKYKVYLDENVCLLKKDFLQKVIALFNADSSLGILGLSGTNVMPMSGIGYTSTKRSGRLIFGNQKDEIVWSEQKKGLSEVLTVDGYTIVTQYDVPWREDLFMEDSFFAEAQSLEFKRRGYKSAVVGQKTAWARYDANEIFYSKSVAKVFCREYFDLLFPKVLVVIPTYNRPGYLRAALESVLSQTYINLEIVISDDSTTDESERMLQEYIHRDSRIKYYRHKGFSMMQNWAWIRQYIRESPLEYVNWLMDDDLFHPEKLTKMMDYYLQADGISLVTSYRRLIDKDGNLQAGEIASTRKICEKTSRYSGKDAGKKLLIEVLNFIGEPTTVLIKKEYMRNGGFDFSEQEERFNIYDFPTWLELLSQGDMIYIAEPLSYFRFYEGQAQCTCSALVVGLICWAREIRYAYDHHIFIENREEHAAALSRLMEVTLKDMHKEQFIDLEKENREYLWKLLQEMLSVIILPIA